MKTKKLITALLSLFLYASCNFTALEGGPYEGFSFLFYNETSNVYDAEIIIGGMKNGVFIPIESIQFMKIKAGGLYYIGENR